MVRVHSDGSVAGGVGEGGGGRHELDGAIGHMELTSQRTLYKGAVHSAKFILICAVLSAKYGKLLFLLERFLWLIY